MIAHLYDADPAIERSYHASIAEMTVDRARADERADNAERLLGEANRKVARLEAQVARLTRQQPRWWEWALAWLICRLEALDATLRRWAL
jgi:hypothetical protein